MDASDDVPSITTEFLTCRMYENKYPAVEDLVIVQVKEIADMGAYVNLLEFGNIQGMILHSELSRRRIRSINKLIRVGNIETVLVTRVDEEKGYIDLSKRRVSPEDVQSKLDRYNKSKAVHSIIRHCAETVKCTMLSLYESFVWDLYERYGHAHDGFTMAVRDADPVLAQYNLSKALYDILMTTIRRKLTPQPIKIRGFMELTCFTYEGIDAIKRALNAAVSCSTDDMQIKVTLIAPPEYVISTVSLDLKVGIDLLNNALDKVRASISAEGGTLEIKVPPKAVSDEDEKNMEAIMAKLEKQAEEEYEVESDED